MIGGTAKAGAALFAFLIKLATVSLGSAPLLTQYFARSRSKVKFPSRFKGWYVPISSMNFPSRGLRPSATTMRYTGVFFAPTRFILILTDIISSNRGGLAPQFNRPPFPRLQKRVG